MKNLFVIVLGLSMAALFSLQAGAMESDVQVQKRAPAPPVQQGQPRQVQRQYYIQTPVQWVTHVTQQNNVSYTQNTQEGTTTAGSAQQDLKQFSQQTQQQMSDFSKL